ncbi:MAG: inositol monophosphatase, partial [Lachnospiraceae bacterium]|nr:inositol monophosphatase [Lachnospiraceae bacterium]
LKLTADLRRTGSSTLDLCYVACGRADLFFELRLCPWDYAAASVIIEEAGGKVTNGEGGEVSLFEKSSVIGMNSVIRLEEI